VPPGRRPLRHRAAELGDQAVLIQAGTYRAAIEQLGEDLTVCAPTSWAARDFVRSLPQVTELPARGFGTSAEEFATWAEQRGRRLLGPVECVQAAETAYRSGEAPLASAEGFVPPDHRLAGLRLAPVLALRAGLPAP
jgi:deoxyribodipyrimidine photolyase-like uncharacterized protein